MEWGNGSVGHCGYAECYEMLLPSYGNPVLHGNDIAYIGTMDMLKLSYGDCNVVLLSAFVGYISIQHCCARPPFFFFNYITDWNVPFIKETVMVTVCCLDVENIFVVATVVP